MTEALLRLREESGMTQSDVADHLGITKAAVSKWECGQSLPDINLLPSIAELYSVSLDDLFGRSATISQKEIDTIYLEALKLLSTDDEEGFSYVSEQIREHWSCLPLIRALSLALFAQIPSAKGFECRPLEGRAQRLAETTEKMLRRAIHLDESGGNLESDIAPLARILQWTGRFNEARDLVENRVSEGADLAALSLAQLYCEEGQEDEAIRVLLTSLLGSLIGSSGALCALAPLVDDSHLKCVDELASRLQQSREYVSLFPMLLPTIRYEMTLRLARDGRSSESVIEALCSFAESLEACIAAMRNPSNPTLFDQVSDLMWEKGDESVIQARESSAENIQSSYLVKFDTDCEWSDYRGNEDFEKVLQSVGKGVIE